MNKTLATKDVVAKMDSLPTSEDLNKLKAEIKNLQDQATKTRNMICTLQDKKAEIENQIDDKKRAYKALLRRYAFETCEIDETEAHLLTE